MQNENKKKVLSLHGLHGLQSAVCSLHGLRFGVTEVFLSILLYDLYPVVIP